MGLAASQARLLTITARKSDAELQSMRYSQQKMALSRNMDAISDEYQASFNKKKLVYDFYGNGDTDTPLSYGLMMSPSIMNGYMPMLVTNATGRVVLNEQYAAAAMAAGIPQDGFVGTPSEATRNIFIQGLMNNGVITPEVAENCMSVQYSQEIGMGSTDLVSMTVEQTDLEGLLDFLSGTQMTMNIPDNKYADNRTSSYHLLEGGKASSKPFTIQDLFNKDYIIYATAPDNTSKLDDEKLFTQLVDNISLWDGWNVIFDSFEKALSVTGSNSEKTEKALEKARASIENILFATYAGGSVHTDGDKAGSGFGYIAEQWQTSESDLNFGLAKDYIGYVGFHNRGGTDYNGGVSISVSNIAKAYLTSFVQSMEDSDTSLVFSEGGVSVTGKNSHGAITFNGSRKVSDNKLINKDYGYTFNAGVSFDVNQDHAMISGFYDALFNQICSKGWAENVNISDNEYLSQVFQQGKYFLTTCSDEGFYRTGNYSTHTAICEVTDDDAIAKAEAKYNTEKLKINQKEEVLDLKLKNLDTEISSLTSEYDTVKSVINKQIEKTFKYYSI